MKQDCIFEIYIDKGFNSNEEQIRKLVQSYNLDHDFMKYSECYFLNNSKSLENLYKNDQKNYEILLSNEELKFIRKSLGYKI